VAGVALDNGELERRNPLRFGLDRGQQDARRDEDDSDAPQHDLESPWTDPAGPAIHCRRRRRDVLAAALCRLEPIRPHAGKSVVVTSVSLRSTWRPWSFRARAADGAPPAPPITETASRLGTVVAVVGVGLLITGLGDALARSGQQWPALPLFFLGLITIFVPCAWRLAGGNAARYERVAVSLVLGVALLGSYYMRSPLIFDWFDELIHGATLTQMLRGRTLDVHNSILPISPYYPGLELFTVAVKWITGLPVVLAQLVVVLAQRVVLVLCVFLVVERLFHSARAGGVGVLVYVCSPTFYTFASWDYGPLALAFAVATVYFLLSAVDARASTSMALVRYRAGPRTLAARRELIHASRDLLLASASMGALIVTHHLTAWLTVGLLVLWALALWRDRRHDDARFVGIAAAIGLVLVASWTAFAGRQLVPYLSGIFSDAEAGFSSAVGHFHSSRPLFHTYSNQGSSSGWEIVVMLAAVVIFCLLLLPSAVAVIWNGTALRGARRWIPLVAAGAYPLAMLASISNGSSQVGERATTFLFFGMSVVLGGWLAIRLTVWPRHMTGKQRLLERVGVIAIASVCFLGGMIFGSGPSITYVPGPYIPGANQRSVGAPTLAAAQWASTHLPAGSNIAADRQSGALLADYADVNLVTTIGGFVDPSPIFFGKTFDDSDVSLIRKDDIRYIVVDQRLATSLPLFGTYFEVGEAPPGTRLTSEELNKFGSLKSISRIYDNGSIQIYDTSRLLVGQSSAPAPPAGDGATGADPIVLLAALGVLIVGCLLVRRRRGRSPITDRILLRWMVGSMVTGMAFAAIMIPTGLPPTLIGLAGLAGVLASIVALTKRRASSTAPQPPSYRERVDRFFNGRNPEQATERRRLFTTFGYLVSKQGMTAAIGLAYWAVVTHLFSAHDVGLAAAAASTALLLSAVGALGIPLLLLAELETMDPAERRVIFTTGLAIAGAVVLVLSIVAMVLSPVLGESLRLIGGDPITALLFVIGSVATIAGLTFDNAAIGLHRGVAQLWHGGLSSGFKLVFVALLVLASTRTSAALIFAWVLALIASFAICLPMIQLKRAQPGTGSLQHRTRLVRRFGTLSLQHHVLNLSISSVSYIIPLTAVLIVSPPQVAYFSAAYLLSATMLIIPYLLALSLFAERSGEPGLLHRHVRRTLSLGLALSGAIVVLVLIAAPLALRLFGPAYAANGTTALRILILVGPAYVIKDHYVSISRAQGRLSHAAKIMAVGTMVEVSGSVVGGVLWGLTGICVGWAISATCEALFLLPSVLHVYRHQPADEPAAIDEAGSVPVNVQSNGRSETSSS
jgi:O-antigen/teichoic acid export membrane protein